jgi:hypothetical protein
MTDFDGNQTEFWYNMIDLCNLPMLY